MNSDYLWALLREVESSVAAEQGAGADVRIEATDDGLAVVLAAHGRRLVHLVDEPVYHYEPDGSDPSRHATWLAQLFDEDAR